MATADDELNQIEKDIRTLKIEYEQFFGGGRKRPPSDTQWRVETLIKRYSDRSGELTFGQRFRYNNLAQTYAKYQDMWRKKLMQKEGAITEHHFGAAARAVEAERARRAAEVQSSPPETHARRAPHQHAITDEADNYPTEAAASAAVVPADFSLSFSDPEHEKDKVKKLYQKLIEARTEAGEKTTAPTLKDFERFVRQKTKDLKQKGGHEVEYSVSIEGGRVKLKARISN